MNIGDKVRYLGMIHLVEKVRNNQALVIRVGVEHVVDCNKFELRGEGNKAIWEELTEAQMARKLEAGR